MKRVPLPFVFWLSCILSYLIGTLIMMFKVASKIGRDVGVHTSRFEAFVASLTASSTAISGVIIMAMIFGILVVLTTKVLVRVFGTERVFPDFS